jgi:hypothetical protein
MVPRKTKGGNLVPGHGKWRVLAGWHYHYCTLACLAGQIYDPPDFWIGESGIWFYSLMWEHGKDRNRSRFWTIAGL